PWPGRTALGGSMVLGLLVCLLVHAGSGLFANEDIVTGGSLVKWISKDLSDRMTGLHHVGFNVLLVLAALHIGGALFYLLVKRDNLIVPMFTGTKKVPEYAADMAQLTLRMKDRRRTPRAPVRRLPELVGLRPDFRPRLGVAAVGARRESFRERLRKRLDQRGVFRDQRGIHRTLAFQHRGNRTHMRLNQGQARFPILDRVFRF